MSAETSSGRTGLELLLESVGDAYYDRDHRVRGVAYEVLGLARLRPLPSARIRARCGGPWAEVVADDRGVFELDVPIPESPGFAPAESPHLEVEVSQGNDERVFEVPLSLRTPLSLDARSDRVTYEPGETAHVWARVQDARTRRPLGGVPVRLEGGGAPQQRVTSAAGIVAFDLPIGSGPGVVSHRSVNVVAGVGDLAAQGTVSFRVGDRPTTDMLVTIEATPDTVGPGEPVTVVVRVRAPSGFPVRGAQVRLYTSHQVVNAITDRNGDATVEVQAPAYSGADRGNVAITGTARHPGYGVATAGGGFRVRPPRSLEVEALSVHGGIVPEIADRLIVSVVVGDGISPAAGATVEVSGAAIAGGRASGVVDRHGYLSIPVRAAPGSFALHVGDSECSQSAAASIDIVVRGEDEQRTRLCVPVLEKALVAPTVRRPAVSPGETIEVRIDRRPAVSTRPVVVELVAQNDDGTLELVQSSIVPATVSQVRFAAPRDRLGIFFVETRPLLDGRDARSAEGFGATEAVLVRPASPAFLGLELDQEVYTIRSDATLTVRTPPGGPAAYVAVLVRDLAQHQGETPFDAYFLRHSLERAVLDPSTPEADLLVRAALVAMSDGAPSTFEDDEPGPMLSRDPVRAARSLLDERVGGWMVAVEQALEEALGAGTVADVTTGEGARRRFRANLVRRAVQDDEVATLGEGRVTTDMLTEVDPSFTFETVARRVVRRRLVRLLAVLSSYLDPDGNDTSRPRGRSTEPPERWLSELVREGVISPTDLHDPWGGTFVLRRTSRRPAFTLAVEAEGYELLSPGPDGRIETPDDVRDPFARVVAEGTLYARSSGEDRLIAALSALSPGSAVLQDLLEAYRRLTDEAIEELAGDFLGAGGASGAGYGSGAGGLHGRRASCPSIRMGSATGMAAALGGMVRRDFPATLHFLPEAAIDPSGTTTLAISLADAPTTYIVEAILWRDDGWLWSESTRLRVDMELVVDAPVPGAVTVGDDLRLPLRVANRTKTARTVWLDVVGSELLDLPPIKAGSVEVPAEDAVEVPVVVPFRRPSKGHLTISARSEDGTPLDAVERPVVVRPDRRRAHDETEDVFRESGTITTKVPDGATPVGASKVTVVLGQAIFAQADAPHWDRWLDGLVGSGGRTKTTIPPWETQALLGSDDPITLAQLVGADWLATRVSDAMLTRPLEVLADHVEGVEPASADDVRDLSRLLLLLAPAVRNAGVRADLDEPLLRLTRSLRVSVESGAALFADAPWLSVRAAAALLTTARSGDPDERALELLERARDAAVAVDEDLWLEGGHDDDDGDELFVATSLLALCETDRGRTDVAYRLVRSVARLLRSSGGDLPEVRGLQAEDHAVAAAAARALGNGRPPRSVVIEVDGERHSIELSDLRGQRNVPRLGEPGEHRVELVDGGREVVVLGLSTEYTVGWQVPPPVVGPFAVSVEGDVGSVDHRSGLVLTIRNRVPRLVTSAVVELGLPAGVEIDEEARNEIRRRSATDPDVSSDTLRLRLPPIAPRRTIEIVLPWLWTSAGQLTGLGVLAYASDRPEALSITPSRRVDVGGLEAAIGGTR